MTSHSIEGLSDGGLSADQIKHMVSRFLGWRLPDPFRPDNGITFTPTAHQRGEYGPAHWPVGSNLLDATQAEAMVRHMIEGLPLSAAPERVERGGWDSSSQSQPCAEKGPQPFSHDAPLSDGKGE